MGMGVKRVRLSGEVVMEVEAVEVMQQRPHVGQREGELRVAKVGAAIPAAAHAHTAQITVRTAEKRR